MAEATPEAPPLQQERYRTRTKWAGGTPAVLRLGCAAKWKSGVRIPGCFVSRQLQDRARYGEEDAPQRASLKKRWLVVNG